MEEGTRSSVAQPPRKLPAQQASIEETEEKAGKLIAAILSHPYRLLWLLLGRVTETFGRV